MKKESIVGSALLAVAIMVAGFALRSGIVTFKSYDRVVSVRGLAEKEVKADKVTWTLTYKEIGNDPSAMYEIVEKKNATIISFLKEGGISESEIFVNPASITDRQADMYSNEVLKNRYKATSEITVASTEVDKVRALMEKQTELMKLGVPIIGEDWGDNGVYYEFTSLNDIKPAMVEEATKNARATAEKFAEDSGSRVGKIKTAYQGQFSIDDTDGTTPYLKSVRVVVTMDYMLED